MHFGEHLKAEREQRGISLNDVAVATRVSLRHLHALEEEKFRELPGGVFNRGIVRSYANYCGLDVEGTVESFQQALRASGMDVESKDDDWVQFAEAVRRSRDGAASQRRWRWAGVVAMVLVVVGIAACVLWLLMHRGLIHLPQKPKAAVSRLLPTARFRPGAR